MMTPASANGTMVNMKTGQGVRWVWGGELPEEVTSEQRPEGGERGTHGAIWGVNGSGRGQSLCKVTRVGITPAWAASSEEAEQDGEKEEERWRGWWEDPMTQSPKGCNEDLAFYSETCEPWRIIYKEQSPKGHRTVSAVRRELKTYGSSLACQQISMIQTTPQHLSGTQFPHLYPRELGWLMPCLSQIQRLEPAALLWVWGDQWVHWPAAHLALAEESLDVVGLVLQHKAAGAQCGSVVVQLQL